jgi:hypothetical protein
VEQEFSTRMKRNKVRVIKIFLSIVSIKDGIYIKFLGWQVFED